MMLRIVDHLDVALLDILIDRIRTAGDDLDADVSSSLNNGKEHVEIFLDRFVCDFRVVRGPVGQEPKLELGRGRSGDPDMSVSPVAELFIESEVFVADIVSADVADFAVNDGDFPVIPVVETQREEFADGDQLRRQEGTFCGACFAQQLSGLSRKLAAPELIVQYPDLNALPGFLGEGVDKLLADPVVFQNIEFYVDARLRGPEVVEHFHEQRLAVGEDLDGIVRREQRVAHVVLKFDVVLVSPEGIQRRILRKRLPQLLGLGRDFLFDFSDLLGAELVDPAA